MAIEIGKPLNEEQVELLIELRAMADEEVRAEDFDIERFEEIMDELFEEDE